MQSRSTMSMYRTVGAISEGSTTGRRAALPRRAPHATMGRALRAPGRDALDGLRRNLARSLLLIRLFQQTAICCD